MLKDLQELIQLSLRKNRLQKDLFLPKVLQSLPCGHQGRAVRLGQPAGLPRHVRRQQGCCPLPSPSPYKFGLPYSSREEAGQILKTSGKKVLKNFKIMNKKSLKPSLGILEKQTSHKPRVLIALKITFNGLIPSVCNRS